MADSISKTGVWVDQASGKVVTSQPERGVQLVAPGGEITPDVQADIDRARGVSRGGEAVETATTVDDTEKAVTTKTVARRK